MTEREPFANLKEDGSYTSVCAGDFRIYSTREAGGAHLDVEGINTAFEKAVAKREADAFNAGLERAADIVRATCQACGGSAIGAVIPEELVSREMAADAGDLSLEGSIYRPAESTQCQYCGSTRMAICQEKKPTGEGK